MTIAAAVTPAGVDSDAIDVAAFVARTRTASGVPERLEDPTVAAKVAAILTHDREEASMSAKAVGWVWEHQGYKGAELLVHLAIADVVNDTYGNELWMSATNLAKKARVSRRTVINTLNKMTDKRQAGGAALELIAKGYAVPPTPSRYRFLFPDWPRIELDRPSAKRDAPSANGDRPRAIDDADLVQPLHPNSRDNSTTQGDPRCVQCNGEGFFRGGQGFDVRCDCTNLRSA